jgi:hypothetical protein
MADGLPWMRAAAETGQAVLKSLSRAGAAPGLYGHQLSYVTSPFRQIVKELTGSVPKKVAEDAWALAPPGKSGWSYQREAAHYLFNAAAGFRYLLVQVLAAVQGERRWRGCVFAAERGFRGGSGCGGVGCDDTVSVSGKGRPSPLAFCRSPGRAVRVLGGTIAHGRQQRGRRRVASR